MIRSQPSVEKIRQALFELKKENEELPARIILFGQDENNDFGQKLIVSKWQDLFVHEPKIESLSDEEIAKAISYAQAADILGFDPTIGVAGQSISLSGIEKAQEDQKPSEDGAGFIEGEDILLFKKKTEEVKDTNQEKAARGKNYAVGHIPSTPKGELKEEHSQPQEKVGTPQKIGFWESAVTLAWFSKILDFFKNSFFSKKFTFAIFGILLLALVAVFIYAKTIVSADIIIKVDPQIIKRGFDEKVALDSSGSVVSGKEITTTETGSQKAVATGTKKIGKYAEGEIQVLNWTTSEVTFPKETIIVSKDQVKFALDSDIQVASRSASSPGQATVHVTAKEFGAKGNIAEGVDLTFQEFDELLYSARSTSAFSGGEEKEITVVSQEDLTKLEKSLLESLSSKAKDSLQNKTDGYKLIEEAISVKVKNKTFDKNLDEEATLVNLNMQVKASAIVFKEEDLKEVLVKSFEEDIPKEFRIRPQDIEILEINVKRQKNSLVLSGEFEVPLVPQFDEGELKDKIRGKSIKQSRAIILELPKVSDVEVKFSPNVPFIGSLPQNKSKIKFDIKTK